MGSLAVIAIMVSALLAAIVLTFLLFRRRATPAEMAERRRRDDLSRFGRLTDGTVLDAQVIPGNNGRESMLLVYAYSVSGVQYECSQDVTILRHLIDIHSCRLGLPTNIKYETNNPGNSIVISESWKGLH